MLGVTEGKWSAEVTGSGNITKSLTQAGKAATKRNWRARGDAWRFLLFCAPMKGR
jgi:hypothetical protein